MNRLTSQQRKFVYLGGMLLLAEWLLFGRMRLPSRAGAAPSPIEFLSRFTAPFRKAS